MGGGYKYQKTVNQQMHTYQKLLRVICVALKFVSVAQYRLRFVL